MENRLDKVIENLLEEPSKSLGKTISDLWYLSFGGKIEFAAKKMSIKYEAALEQFAQEIRSAISTVPQNKTVDVDMHTIGLALENSKFCLEIESLRKMIAMLIASSINADRVKYVHPSFSEIIKNLCSDEAMILNTIFKTYRTIDNRFHCLKIRYIKDNQVEGGRGILAKKVDKYGAMNCNINKTNSCICETLYDNFSIIGYESKCSFPQEITTYLENLARLGIIEIREQGLETFSGYERIINNTDLVELLIDFYNNNFESQNRAIYFTFQKHYFCLTNLGINFIESCFE